jgi:L-ascorbate metabolism protein UlaG (beta-lactamase superfamily)
MHITFYGYNAFLIETADKKLAIDPGALFFHWFRLNPLIPRPEWPDITHIFITHGDPDHYWHADRVAKASGAPLVCNRTMVSTTDGKSLMLGPRSKGLAFTADINRLHTLGVGETIELDGMSIRGIEARHGELTLKLGPVSRTFTPGPSERIGWGAMGFDIRLGETRIVNLGDTLLLEEAWQGIEKPDVLMLPIGGGSVHNTMDVESALKAVALIQPGLVIPCHYNCPVFFTRDFNPADDQRFKREVEKTGARCALLKVGESIALGGL